MIKVVRGPVDYSTQEPDVLFIDEESGCYSISYKFGSGSVTTYAVTKEIADAISETVEIAKIAEQLKAEATQMRPGRVIELKTEQKPVTDVGQMVDKGYSAQDLINLKREGIL